jgi:hypothetical protein
VSHAGATATNAKTLRRQQADVEAFSLALRQLISVLTPRPGSIIFDDPGGYAPTPGREEEAQRFTDEVNRAAGRAAQVFGEHGAVIQWKERGPGTPWRNVNPAAGWTTILSDDPMFDLAAILSMCEQAVGALDAKATVAEEREQSFEGRVAHVTGFWGRVKPTGRSQSAGFLQGVAVTVVGGVLLALVLHLFG